VIFAVDFCSRVSAALERLYEMDSSWGMCYLGRLQIEPDISLEDGLVRPGYSHCTFAYVLSAAGLDAVLESGYDQGLIPVDEFLPAMYADHPRRDVRSMYPSRMTAYALEPPVVRQLPKNVAGSDTEDSAYVVQRGGVDGSARSA
jgi:glycosyl transferase family 25